MKIWMFTLPNMLTLGNLLCGCVALYYCLSVGNLSIVFWLVVAAAVFDFLDGFAARLTGQYSEMGKQLDSLADMVSAGVVPSAIAFTVYNITAGGGFHPALSILTASVALFSALRLARFNIDETQSGEFRGLPTPACALFFASVGWLFEKGLFTAGPFVIIGVSLLFSYLLICPLRMFSLKFSDYSWRNNKVRYIFLALSAASLAVWQIIAVPFIIGGYILVSALTSLVCRKSRNGVTGMPEIPNE